MSGIVLSPSETRIPRIVQAIRQLYEGRVNSGGVVTLRNGQTTTVVQAQNCSPSCAVFLTPQSAHAASMAPQPYVAKADILLGSFVISHNNPGVADSNFAWDARG